MRMGDGGLPRSGPLPGLVATQLVIRTQPVGDLSGANLVQQPVVDFADSFGAQVNSQAGSVTASILTGNGTLAGTVTVAAVAGRVTFADLNITAIVNGGFTLRFSGGGFTVDSASTAISGPTTIVITRQPVGDVSGIVLSPQPIVKIVNDNGTTVPTFTGAIAVAILAGAGSLAGTTSLAAVAGIATFTNLNITGNDSFTLRFTGSGLASATSGAMAISGPTALAITTQPASWSTGQLLNVQPVIRVVNGNGSLCSNATNAVTVARTTGVDALSGTLTQSAVAGVVAYGDLVLTGSGGGDKFTFSASGLTGVVSITITDADPFNLPAPSLAGKTMLLAPNFDSYATFADAHSIDGWVSAAANPNLNDFGNNDTVGSNIIRVGEAPGGHNALGLQYYLNITTLNGAADGSTASVVVASDADKLRNPATWTGDQAPQLQIDYQTAVQEVVAVTARSGNTLTVVRVGIQSGSFVVGRVYTILTPGITDFTLIGAANSNVGTVFTATGPGSSAGSTAKVAAGSFVVGHKYTITDVGSTNFTAIGAASNTPGVVFTATGVGSGSGQARDNAGAPGFAVPSHANGALVGPGPQESHKWAIAVPGSLAGKNGHAIYVAFKARLKSSSTGGLMLDADAYHQLGIKFLELFHPLGDRAQFNTGYSTLGRALPPNPPSVGGSTVQQFYGNGGSSTISQAAQARGPWWASNDGVWVDFVCKLMAHSTPGPLQILNGGRVQLIGGGGLMVQNIGSASGGAMTIGPVNSGTTWAGTISAGDTFRVGGEAGSDIDGAYGPVHTITGGPYTCSGTTPQTITFSPPLASTIANGTRLIELSSAFTSRDGVALAWMNGTLILAVGAAYVDQLVPGATDTGSPYHPPKWCQSVDLDSIETNLNINLLQWGEPRAVGIHTCSFDIAALQVARD